MRSIGTIAAMLAAAAGLVLAAATAASASPTTPSAAPTAAPSSHGGCGAGVWSGWENTQADQDNLAISVLNGKVVALAHQTRGFFGVGGSNECFFWFGVAGTAVNAKYAVEANPATGIPEGQALTAMWSGPARSWVVGLASTAKGSAAQQWVYTGGETSGPWTNAASGDELESHGSGHQITLVSPATPASDATTWHYVGL